MTSDELRRLADEAVLGPWTIREDEVVADWDGASFVVVAQDPRSRPLVAALGPDAARLLADAMEELLALGDRECSDLSETAFHWHGTHVANREESAEDCTVCRVDALLARFAALEHQP